MKKLLIILLILVPVLYSLDVAYTFGLRHNLNLKASYVKIRKQQTDLLIHGPCEPLWMIDPEQLDLKTGKRSYNLALSHSDFADNYLHLYLYLKHNPAPRHLLIYATPESFDPAYNTFNTYRFAPWLDDPLVDSVVSECDPDYHRYSKLPFMRYAYYNKRLSFYALQGWKHWLLQRQEAYSPNGYEMPKQIVWDNHLEELHRLYPQGYSFSWDAKRESYFRAIVRLAVSRGINVIVYESPVLNESIVATVNRKEITDRISELSRQCGTKYVQFSDPTLAGSRKYFMSALNTNLEGSAIFVDSLASYLNMQVFK
jgi:hypothetical protein